MTQLASPTSVSPAASLTTGPRSPLGQLVAILSGTFALSTLVAVAVGTRWLAESSQALAVPLLQLTPLVVSLVVWAAFGRTQPLAQLWALRPELPRPRGSVIRSLLAITGVILVIGVGQACLAWSLGVPVTIDTARLGSLALVPVVAIVLSFTCFGEEVVWRGHLFALLKAASPWHRVLITAVIWSLWHAPLVIGYVASGQSSHREAAASLLNILVAGLVLGWMRLASGQLWPAVWGHALMNSALIAISAVVVPSLAAMSNLNFWLFQGVGMVLWLVAARLLGARHHETQPS